MKNRPPKNEPNDDFGTVTIFRSLWLLLLLLLRERRKKENSLENTPRDSKFVGGVYSKGKRIMWTLRITTNGRLRSLSSSSSALALAKPSNNSLVRFHHDCRSRLLDKYWRHRYCQNHTSLLSAVATTTTNNNNNLDSYRNSCGDHHRHRRWMSSRRRGGGNNKGFQLDALPFTISPDEALESFRKWAEQEQGLNYLLSYDSVRIGAAFVPVWSFDINIRFRTTQAGSNRNWKPPLFAVFGSQPVIHVPGLSAYAGYSYRRSLVNPVHSTALVFMGDQVQPFGSWMLRDLVLERRPIQVVPDAWNATQGRAFAIVKEELQAIVDQSWEDEEGSTPPPKAETEIVKSRRVYMPTYVIEYQILGLQYKAFVSGCDKGASVSGVSHQIFGQYGNMFTMPSPETAQASLTFVGRAISRAPALFRPLITLVGSLVLRIGAKIPIIGLVGGLLAGYRKILQPWMDSRLGSARWERQREHEALMEDDDDEYGLKDDFVEPSGSARLYFFRHKEEILRALGGDQNQHEEGDWYKDWEEWARQQWQQQERAQQQQAYQWQQQQRQQSGYQRPPPHQQQTKQKKKPEYQWDFDPNDPYSVLGIRRGATKKQVSEAFRKEMLKHHPDTQPNATKAQKERAVERSKYITEAYRKIKAEQKR